MARDLLHQRAVRRDRAFPHAALRAGNARAGEALDIPGAALATAGLGSLVYGLIELSTPALVASLPLLAAFVAVEWHSRSPMMPLGLFRSHAFCGTNVITLFLYGALGGCLFFVPMNLMQVQGFTATQAGAHSMKRSIT